MKFSEDYFGGSDEKDYSLEPPAPGYIRHQYFFAIDGPTFNSWTHDERVKWLCNYFADYISLAEVAMNTKEWIIYKLWIDLPEEIELGP